jgi:hypothetical protein
MLRIHLDLKDLEKATGKELHCKTISFKGVRIVCRTVHCYVERPMIDATVPDPIKKMVDFFTFEETIAGPGKQWRHGHYRHRDTGDADAFFDGVGDSRTLKMHSTNQANLIELYNTVLQIRPGDRNRIDGLIEPPIDDWNAGYEEALRAKEAGKPRIGQRFDIAIFMMQVGAEHNAVLKQLFEEWLAKQPQPCPTLMAEWIAHVLLA